MDLSCRGSTSGVSSFCSCAWGVDLDRASSSGDCGFGRCGALWKAEDDTHRWLEVRGGGGHSWRAQQQEAAAAAGSKKAAATRFGRTVATRRSVWWVRTRCIIFFTCAAVTFNHRLGLEKKALKVMFNFKYVLHRNPVPSCFYKLTMGKKVQVGSYSSLVNIWNIYNLLSESEWTFYDLVTSIVIEILLILQTSTGWLALGWFVQ